MGWNIDFVTLLHTCRLQTSVAQNTQIISIPATVTPKFVQGAWKGKHHWATLLEARMHRHRESVTGNILFTWWSPMIPTQWRGWHSALCHSSIYKAPPISPSLNDSHRNPGLQHNFFHGISEIPRVAERLAHLWGNVLWNLFLCMS